MNITWFAKENLLDQIPFLMKSSIGRTCSGMLLFFFFASCNENVPVTLPQFESRLVAESYIVGGDSAIVVRLDQTIDPLAPSYWSATDTSFAAAEVKIKFDDTLHSLKRLLYADQQRYAHDVRYGRVFAIDGMIVGEKTFQLTVDYQNRHIEAECSMPSPIQVASATLSGTLDNSGYFTGFRIGIVAKFPAGSSYFMVCVMSKNYDWPTKDSIWQDIARGYFVANNRVDYEEFNLINSSPSKRRSGYYKVLIARIEKTYYDFALASRAQYGELDSVIPTETTEVPSNIRGGYGIFTAMSCDTLMVSIP